MVRENREADKQNLGFCARPFVLCGLPSGDLQQGVFSTSAGTVSSYYR